MKENDYSEKTIYVTTRYKIFQKIYANIRAIAQSAFQNGDQIVAS